MCLKNEAVSLSSVQIWRAFVFKAMSFSVESISLIACHLWALSGGPGHLARHFFPEHKHLIFLPLSCLQPLDSNLPYFIQWKWDREGLFWVQTLLSGWHFSYRLQYCLVFFFRGSQRAGHAEQRKEHHPALTTCSCCPRPALLYHIQLTWNCSVSPPALSEECCAG